MRPITITKNARGDVEVWRDGKTTDALCLGEVFEQILGLVFGMAKVYPMKTPAEWQAQEERAALRRAERDAGDLASWERLPEAMERKRREEDFLSAMLGEIKATERDIRRFRGGPEIPPPILLNHDPDSPKFRSIGELIAATNSILPEGVPPMKDVYRFEIFRRLTLRGRRVFWRLIAGNNEIVAAGHPRGYRDGLAARKTIHRIQTLAKGAPIVDLDA